MQVQALEQHLGLPLFRRDGRGVEMTAEGVLMLPLVREGLGMLQLALDGARVVRTRAPGAPACQPTRGPKACGQ
jgi:DNA-binding transcriptional LysR family regulator